MRKTYFPKKDLTNLKFGKLLVIGYDKYAIDKNGWKSPYWLCKCDCGNIKSVRANSLITKTTTSCGCYFKEQAIKRFGKHGLYAKNRVEHRIWVSMIQRCSNTKTIAYKRYGERGIRVCNRWLKFEYFLLDMGKRPLGMTLERKNNDKNYCKSNCVWATMLVQSNNKCNNKWITWNGETKTLSEWGRTLGVKADTIAHRLKRNIPIEKIMFSGNLKAI